jgi:glucoamylase
MAKITSKITGDQFEAPAADFTDEPHFEVTDAGNELTDGAALATAPSVTSGTTESTTDTSSAAPVAPSDAPVDSGNVEASSPAGSTSGDASPSATGTADLGNVAASSDTSTTDTTSDGSLVTGDATTVQNGADLHADGTPLDAGNAAPAASTADVAPTGDVGNVDASTAPSDSATPASVADSAAADAATPVAVVATPSTDSVSASPTGGPTAGAGSTLDAKDKHQVLAILESGLVSELADVVQWTEQLQHAADAFFTALHSQIDV